MSRLFLEKEWTVIIARGSVEKGVKLCRNVAYEGQSGDSKQWTILVSAISSGANSVLTITCLCE
jgi:hypothetical protein